MHLEIVTPDKNLFKGEAEYVYCPGTHGAFGILNNHAPIISPLKAGKVKVKISEANAMRFDQESGKLVNDNKIGEEVTFDIKGGVVEVLNNKVTLLAE